MSSPSDVEFERQRVDCVVERLNGVFMDIARFETFRWEKSFYSAHQSYQPQIDEAQKLTDCEIVIAVFWSRIGSPLPQHFCRLPDGEPYPSGSAYEVLTAIEARRKNDRPDVYVFRKSEPPIHRIDREEELAAAKLQLAGLKTFFEHWFHKADGLIPYHRFKTTDDFEDQIERLLREWVDKYIPHDRTVAWPIETKGTPFRALLPFDAKHAPVYFGRDRKVTRAIEQLKRVALGERSGPSGPRGIAFLLIVGESGSGKSSLMRAGLAPRLTAAGAVLGVDMWRTAIIRVGDDLNPFLSLARALFVTGKSDDTGGFGAALPELCSGKCNTPEMLAGALASGTAGKIAILKALALAARDETKRGGFDRPRRANFLLLVDQLENIFGSGITEDQRSAFARILFALSSTRRIWVVATLRSDLYGRMITRGDFIALKDAGADYDLAAPGESELAEIVHKSATETGLVYETNPQAGERLDDRILKDATGESSLPLLEFTLDRLFKDRKVVDGETRLTFAAYEAMGGLDGAINQTAEHALRKLGKKEIAELPRLVRTLAEPVHDHKAGTTGRGELTARAVPVNDVIRNAETTALVDALIDARIIVVTGAQSGNGEDGGAMIGIAHQRVFEAWKEARRIVEDHKAYFRIRDEVEKACLRWNSKDPDSAYLLQKGVPLAEGEKLVTSYGDEINDDVRAFVSASSRRARRNQRILTGVAAGLAVLLVIAIGAGLIAYTAKREADSNYNAAKTTADNLVTEIAKGLGDVEGLRVKTIDTMLRIVKTAIDQLRAASHGDPGLKRIQATELYQFAKDFQKVNDFAKAREMADESLVLRSSLIGYDRLKFPQSADIPGQLRWELSESIELIGDLDRKDKLVEKARERFNEALAIRRQLVKQSPDNNEWAKGISFSYVRIGDLDHESNHDLDSAQQNYEYALNNAVEIFRRAPDDLPWQRELSFDFNKVGDIHLERGETSAKNSDVAGKSTELTVALNDFGNSLCIRRRLDAHEENDTKLKRDITYTLGRIGSANEDLGNQLAAADDYFESLAISRQLSKGDPDDLRYIGDIATTLERLGDIYQSPAPEAERGSGPLAHVASGRLELALAFYEKALYTRKQLSRKKTEDKEESPLEKKIEEVRARIDDKSKLVGTWWTEPVHAEEEDFARRQQGERETSSCWALVQKTVEEIGDLAQISSVI